MKFIAADWSAPVQVKALTTTRQGGYSSGVFAGLNLGDHVADDAALVAQNRALLLADLGLKRSPQWLSQVHGTRVVAASDGGEVIEADACWTDQKGLACIIMTADCLPVFFCDRQGSRVAVAHAGWRGLADGILENTLAIFEDPSDVLVWLGPAIGPAAFEVGAEVRERFLLADSEAEAAFKAVKGKPDKFMADIYYLAEMRLTAVGVNRVTRCDLCTFTDRQQFYSYRRDGQTGRMASLIWLEA
ncbi:MAG: multi-copper polyphenol oxidoreductase [Neptuniibacter caesariensis]|uniref:Purine nucleoside phosphorylase n=1 Tax=Neptuniibacter caesariensis TaxID=207954 RepID=A0A2G6JBY8_NEPCE|nr:MAG: multi-copper polyphenol oxidoreductase [Neptuniibacter caesariensis]